MEPALLSDQKANGGYFEPPAEVPTRLVRVHHDACGADTRVRLPETVPARAVRRLRCSGCDQAFETETAVEAEPEAAVATEASAEPKRLRLPALPKLSGGAPKLPKIELKRPALADLDPRKLKLPKLDPESRGWKLASIPIAAVAVVVALILLQGDDPAPAPQPIAAEQAGTDVPDSTTPADDPTVQGKPAKNNKLVRGSSYSLALPAGWERTDPPAGATFAAASADGGADATLWIDEDPKLDFPQFIDQSLKQLQALAGSAQIVDRVAAPTPEATVVKLAADAPEGQPSYEVTLRVAGPYRYYLATSVQPDASAKAAQGAELIAGSFTPEVAK